MLEEITEAEVSSSSHLFGKTELLNRCKKVADIIFNEEKANEKLLQEIDLKGTFLFHGHTGTGKTTLAYEVIRYVESTYHVTPYRLNITSIITSGLGDTLKNFEIAFGNIKEKLNIGIFILLDEFDRFVVNRESDVEISELKRALLSIMDFFGSIKYSDRIMLIGITNHIKSIDSALIRRFSFVDEITITPQEVERYYSSNERLFTDNGIHLTREEIGKYKTIAELKKELRNKYIEIS